MTNNDIFYGTVFAAENPLPLILCSVLTGALLGIVLDSASLLERIFGKNRIIRFFVDFLSVLTAYLFLFVCALNFNNGMVRWYHVFFSFVSYKVYKKTLSHIILKILDMLCAAVRKICSAVSAVTAFAARPVRAVFAAASKAYGRAEAKHCRRVSENLYKKEKLKFTKAAGRGFGLVGDNLPRNDGDNKWKIKKSENRQRLQFYL